MFRFFYIIIRGGQKFRHHAFDIVADISRLGQRRCVRDRQRNIQKPGKGPDKICLAASCGPYHQHIGLLDLNLVHGICGNALIVIVYCHRHDFLGVFLAYHIFVQRRLDLMGSRYLLQIQRRLFLLRLFLLWRLPGLCHLVLKASQIDHAHAGHIEQIGIIKAAPADLLVYAVKTLLHTVRTDMYIIGKIDQFPGLALRPAAESTESHRILFFFVMAVVFSPGNLVFIIICHIYSFPSCVPPLSHTFRVQAERTNAQTAGILSGNRRLCVHYIIPRKYLT